MTEIRAASNPGVSFLGVDSRSGLGTPLLYATLASLLFAGLAIGGAVYLAYKDPF